MNLTDPIIRGVGIPLSSPEARGQRDDGQNYFRMTRRGLISFPREDHANVEQSVDCHMHQEILLERDIPSFRIREYKVVRLIPKRAAAPFGPMITPRVCCSVLQMCSRFKSSRVTGSPGELTSAPDPSLARGQQRVLPDVSITLHSMKFCSSRIFPGHE